MSWLDDFFESDVHKTAKKSYDEPTDQDFLAAENYLGTFETRKSSGFSKFEKELELDREQRFQRKRVTANSAFVPDDEEEHSAVEGPFPWTRKGTPGNVTLGGSDNEEIKQFPDLELDWSREESI